MRVGVVLLIAAAGCGRFGFAATETGVDAPTGPGGDAAENGDATTLDLACDSASVFCDDFEVASGTTFPQWSAIDLETWTAGTAPAAGTLARVTTTTVWRGAQSLETDANGGSQQAFLTKHMASRPNPLYTRVMMLVPDGTFQTFDFLGFLNGPYTFLELNPANGRVSFDSTYGLSGASAPVMTERNHWYCIQTMINFAATGGELAVTIDGTQILDVMGETQPAGVTLDKFDLGVSSGAPETADVVTFYDGVALSDQPIPCD